MRETEAILLTLGGLLLVGLATDALGRHTPLPRVTLLLLFGILIGPCGANWVPLALTANFEFIANIALLMVGFLLGEKFTPKHWHEAGSGIGLIVLCEGLCTALVVGLGLWASGMPLAAAVSLACIAASSDPATTTDVVSEERSDGPFTSKLTTVVALDDGLGLVLFSVGIGAVGSIYANAEGTSALATVVWEIGGAIGLGVLLGVPGALLSGRLKRGQPTLVEALALVFLCGGLANVTEVSFLIAAMTMGAVVANLASHHERPFHAIAGIEWPFMIIFFVVAGATLEVKTLGTFGLVGALYIVCRVTGKLIGAATGSNLTQAGPATTRWLGWALLPQAGVAMGMALVAANRFPQHGQLVLAVVVSTTVVFEIFGPVCTRMALRRTGESGHAR